MLQLVPASCSRVLSQCGSALFIPPAEPVTPDHLVLHALNTSSLQASWSSSEGAAWFHLMLTDLLEGTNLTEVLRRGASNHTFLRLTPGTPYKLRLCAVAGPHQVVGPSATEWTCECLGDTTEADPVSSGQVAKNRASPKAWKGVPLWMTCGWQLPEEMVVVIMVKIH